MNQDHLYEDWKRRRGQADLSAGFADRVMAAVASHEAGRRQHSLLSGLLLALLSSRLGRFGVVSLAAATCVVRLLHVVAMFVAQ